MDVFQGGYGGEEQEMRKRYLLEMCMKGNWQKVADMYEQYPSLQNIRLTASKETALHIAVSECRQVSVIRQLVKQIEETERMMGERPGALWIPNDRGNTPLHLAALNGDVGMCMSIAEYDQELVGVRNITGETPLFLAALRGQKDAFLYLHRICDPNKLYHYHRRGGDGQTVLHVAIVGDYFDLAYQIICKYDDQILFAFNHQGYTPLHLLASKPAAFKSRSRLHGFISTIIYRFLHVKKLEERLPSYNFEQSHTEMYKYFSSKSPQRQRAPQHFYEYPENYKTCITCFQTLLNLIKGPVTSSKNSTASQQHAQANDVNHWKDLEKGHIGTGCNQGKQSNNIMADEERFQVFPPNYHTSIMIIKLVCRAPLTILRAIPGILQLIVWLLGLRQIIKKTRAKKEKNIWSLQIIDHILDKSSRFGYDINYKGGRPLDRIAIGPDDMPEELDKAIGGRETPILVAAKNGITEIVMAILNVFPFAILDRDSANKNIVHLAVENRRPHLYLKLLRNLKFYESAFLAVDNNGNSVLHLAAILGDYELFPIATLQMQWEIKWFKFVKLSVPRDFFPNLNNEEMTAKKLFRKSHKELVKQGGKWLISTSNSCSVVATVVTTVAFATSATIPGGMKEASGKPILEHHPGFIVFAISSLIALSFSVTSLIAFLSILTPTHDHEDFEKRLPKKLLYALTYLFISLAAMLVSFCAAHFYLVKDDLHHNAFLVYGLRYLPVVYFAMKQFPFYIGLVRDTFSRWPRDLPS